MLMMTCLVCVNTSHAELKQDIVKIGYGFPFVTADVDEDEINPNQYDGYNLDAHRGRFAQIILSGGGMLDNPITFKYMSIDTEEENGEIETNKFQSFSLGFAQGNWVPLSGDLDGYGMADVGIGVSRFSFDKTRNRMHADVGLEVGLALQKTFTLGARVNYLLVGYPGETIAHAGLFTATLGVRF